MSRILSTLKIKNMKKTSDNQRPCSLHSSGAIQRGAGNILDSAQAKKNTQTPTFTSQDENNIRPQNPHFVITDLPKKIMKGVIDVY